MTQLPQDIQTRISRMAMTEWPDDPGMQRAVMERQTAAWHELHALQLEFGADAFMRQVFEYAADDWPDDFEMELHTVRMQATAAMAYARFEANDVPGEVMDRMRMDVMLCCRDDHEMRLLLLEQKVLAWRQQQG